MEKPQEKSHKEVEKPRVNTTAVGCAIREKNAVTTTRLVVGKKENQKSCIMTHTADKGDQEGTLLLV